MIEIVALLVFFVLLGLLARRFQGRAHALLVAGIVMLLAYEVYHLSRL